MAVARLNRVTVGAPSRQIGSLVGLLIACGEFHPAQRDGLVQDIRLLRLSSRAQATYGRARQLLSLDPFRGLPTHGPAVVRYASNDVGEILTDFEEDLTILEKDTTLFRAPEDRQLVADILASILDDSLDLFHALDRLRAVPGNDDRLTIEGFVPVRHEAEFKVELGPFLVRSEPVRRRAAEDAYVPTLLVNPRVIALFEQMTTQRGIPRYSEIDPTPIVALVFPLFFGIMFGDLGHGLTLMAAGAYLTLRTRYDYWGRLIIAFGVSSSIVGTLRGTFFGVPFATPFAQVLPLPAALNASLTFSYIPLLLEMALFIGTVHLASAYVIAVVNQVRSGRYADAIENGLPTLLLYVALVPFALAIAGTGFHPGSVFSDTSETPFFAAFFGLRIPVATTAASTFPLVVAALATMIFAPATLEYRARHRWKRVPRALASGAFLALSRPAEFALNTVSYIRLAALLITNTLLSVLVAGALAYGVLGLTVAAFLNLALMAMEGLIVYLQDMRLHWLEWLPKFYSGTGTAFSPLVERGHRARFAASPRPG